jgi:hypothetical protein
MEGRHDGHFAWAHTLEKDHRETLAIARKNEESASSHAFPRMKGGYSTDRIATRILFHTRDLIVSTETIIVRAASGHNSML